MYVIVIYLFIFEILNCYSCVVIFVTLLLLIFIVKSHIIINERTLDLFFFLLLSKYNINSNR